MNDEPAKFGSPADNAKEFHASQVMFNRVSHDDGRHHYELFFDTYEDGWHRFVLDSDVAAELLHLAAFWIGNDTEGQR
ncbi:hypothetical protein A5675_11005 [Mycobacterium malmoense]|uniref:hypothetical protein n=1 Tax=Mycobacterium malmoense TaxID=1780 RepID=UPI00080BFBB8|nr:hypothetical protein [Mycobacterium malmoense]OCB41041.1 hypothetical protein A5675_11005 [Mycobacterium malmoense]